MIDPDDAPQCEHEWVWTDTWEGDPTIHHGVHDLSCWKCERCGETSNEVPRWYLMLLDNRRD